MPGIDVYKALTEAGIEVDKVRFRMLDEANQIRVADEALTNMMKFITDKYNSLDFSEIEKSAGNYKRFKYMGMIDENITMLKDVYENTSEEGAKKYYEVIGSCVVVRDHLISNADTYTVLYKQGNGLVQLMYTSLVAALLYAIGTLVSNTIRFVTSEKETECEVLFDEIPGTIKHIHIKNIMSAAADIDTFNKALAGFASPNTRKAMAESVTTTAVVTAIIGTGVILMLLPKIIYMIREIIYSIYYTRVKISDMLGVQAELIRVNVESLEAGRGNKKVIARQRKIAEKLEKWKDRIAVKLDTAEQLKNTQMRKENAQLKIEKDSPIMYYPDPETSGEGLLI